MRKSGNKNRNSNNFDKIAISLGILYKFHIDSTYKINVFIIRGDITESVLFLICCFACSIPSSLRSYDQKNALSLPSHRLQYSTILWSGVNS